MQWAETGSKLEKACEEVHESRALLHQGYEEVKPVKLTLESQQTVVSKRIDDLHALEHQRASVNKRLENLQDSFGTLPTPQADECDPGKTSDVLRNIEYNLRKEGERRKSLTARLKSRSTGILKASSEASSGDSSSRSLTDAVLANVSEVQSSGGADSAPSIRGLVEATVLQFSIDVTSDATAGEVQLVCRSGACCNRERHRC
mmetsp:Transcript_31055/g.47981  ORF Transcript_31055/g.47981 Transcript_31055/m.47981 type:complete len:203 (+) Transcript_31055:256-864(+)